MRMCVMLQMQPGAPLVLMVEAFSALKPDDAAIAAPAPANSSNNGGGAALSSQHVSGPFGVGGLDVSAVVAKPYLVREVPAELYDETAVVRATQIHLLLRLSHVAQRFLCVDCTGLPWHNHVEAAELRPAIICNASQLRRKPAVTSPPSRQGACWLRV